MFFQAQNPSIFPEPADLPLAEAPGAALGEVAEAQRAEADPPQGETRLPTASSIRRTWRLRPSRRTISISRGPRRSTRAGPVGPSSSSTPRRSRSQLRLPDRAPQPGAVGLGDLVAGVREAVGELAVVGQQQQAGRVGVEASHRVEPARESDQLDDRPRRAPGSRAVETTPAGLLTAQTCPLRLDADRPAVDPHVVLSGDVPRRIGDHLAAHGHRPPCR